MAKNDIVPATRFPVQRFEATGSVTIAGVRYSFYMRRNNGNPVVNSYSITKRDSEDALRADSEEYKLVITALREVFKGTV